MRGKISLIIPLRNEMRHGRLRELLSSIRKQSLLPDEVIFVDGKSDDGTYEYLSEKTGMLLRNDNIIVKLISVESNISLARNIGARKSIGDYLLFTDASCVLPIDWVEKMYSSFDGDHDVVSGGYVAVYDKISKLDEAISTTIVKQIKNWDKDTFLPSARSLGVTRDSFFDVGGFPEELDIGEDTEFDLRLKDKGYLFKMQLDSNVQWKMGGGLMSFTKKLFRYGKGDGKNNRMIRSRGLLALIFLMFNLLIFYNVSLFLILFLGYIIFEGVNLARVNNNFGLLKEYLLIGWLKWYAYFTGFLYGSTFGRFGL